MSVSEKSCTGCFKSLADDSRLRILRLLQIAPKSVNEITEHIQLTQPTVSHHLHVLQTHGVITMTKKGRNVIYSYNSAHPCVGCGVFSAPIKI